MKMRYERRYPPAVNSPARPGAFIRIGNGAGVDRAMLHKPHYDFNDEILPLGAGYWARLAESVLAK
jgi:hippurate hydrolase